MYGQRLTNSTDRVTNDASDPVFEEYMVYNYNDSFFGYVVSLVSCGSLKYLKEYIFIVYVYTMKNQGSVVYCRSPPVALFLGN